MPKDEDKEIESRKGEGGGQILLVTCLLFMGFYKNKRN